MILLFHYFCMEFSQENPWEAYHIVMYNDFTAQASLQPSTVSPVAESTEYGAVHLEAAYGVQPPI